MGMCLGGMHETRCLHPSIMLHTYEVYARQHDAIKHQEGKDDFVCIACIKRNAQALSSANSDRCWNVTYIAHVYLSGKYSRLCIFSASNF
jgi:hypothetical protein